MKKSKEEKDMYRESSIIEEAFPEPERFSDESTEWNSDEDNFNYNELQFN